MAIRLERRTGWLHARTTLALLGFAALATLLLLAGHVDHVIAALPLALILACPLMHLFMHGGHGGHHLPQGDAQRQQAVGKSERENQ
jgi:hypothetical protein